MHADFEVRGQLPVPARNQGTLVDQAVVEWVCRHCMPTHLKVALGRAAGTVEVTCDWFHGAHLSREQAGAAQAYVLAAVERFAPADVPVVVRSGRFSSPSDDPRVEVSVDFLERGGDGAGKAQA